MGRASVKANKNIYQIKREEQKLTREKASEKLGISSDRIEKIENRGATPYPEEVIIMADKYKDSALCNYYCSKECAIGRKYVPEVKVESDFIKIVMEMMVSLNTMQAKRDRLMEICVDNTVDEDQIEDFINIQDELEKLSIQVETLQLWFEQMLSEGKINANIYNKIKSNK